MRGLSRTRPLWLVLSLLLLPHVHVLAPASGLPPQTPCNFTIVMFDTRALSFVSQYPTGPESYWTKTALVNSLYARAHGYRFQYYHLSESCPTRRASLGRAPTQTGGFAAAWYKLYAVLHALRHARRAALPCHWGLFLDSDAAVRSPDVRLEALVANISRQLGDAQWLARASAVFEIEGGDHETLVNSGVWLFNYARAEPLLLRWIHEGHGACKDKSTVWPYEQACLERLLGVRARRPGLVGFRAVGTAEVGLIGPTTMNSPHGWFARHLWSDAVGVPLRSTVFDALLRRHMDLTAVEWNARLSDLLSRLYVEYHPFAPPYLRHSRGVDVLDPSQRPIPKV